MAALLLSKISTVLFVQYGNAVNPRAHFQWAGSYTISDDGTSVRLRIHSNNVPPDEYYANVLTELKVNGQTPSTLSEAKTLLNSIFGS